MSTIDKVDVQLGLVYKAFSAGVQDASSILDDFEARSKARLAGLEIAAPRIDEGGISKQTAAAAVTAGDLAAAFAPIGATITRSLTEAVRPLQGFASTFGRQFEEVGATVEKLSVRIDDAMRFPAFLRRVETFRKAFLSRFGLTMKEAGDSAANALNRDVDVSRLVAGYQKVSASVKQAVKPIPGDVGFALEAAGHVDAKASFASYLKGLDEVQSEAIDKMRHMADAVQNATGKGSRKGRWKARDRAADLDATIGNVPPRDNSTAATEAPKPSGWEMLGKAARVAGNVAKAAIEDLSKWAQQDARDIDRLIGTWLKFKKVGSVLSTFGSVADATFGKLKRAVVPKIGVDPRQSTILKGIGSAADRTASSFKGLGQQVLMAFGVFGLAFKAVDFLKDGVVAAAGLNETLNKTDAVLGQASGGVKKFADDMGARFGLVKKDTLDVASGFGGLFKGIGGQSGQALEESTKDFTKLAADLSSFANLSFAEAGAALRTALSGNESDTLKGLGVVTDENTVKAYAYAHGIAKVGSELTNQQKLAARSGVIMEGLADAQGDLDRTSSSTANQFRKLTGTITNIGAQVGSALMPAIDAALGAFNKMATWASTAFAGAGDSLGALVGRVQDGFELVQAAMDNPKAAFEVFRLKALEVLANVGAYLETLGPNIAIVAAYIRDNWKLLLGDAFSWTINAIKNLFSNFEAIGKAIVDYLANPLDGFKVDWTPLSKGFEATAEKLPELIKPALVDMSREINAAAQPIVDAVKAKADRAKAAAEAAAKAAAAKAAKADGPTAEKEIVSFAKSLAKSTRTPLEAFREQVGKIRDAFGAGLIDEETGLRGIAEAHKSLEGNGPKFAGAVEAGSTDARSAILNAMAQKATKSPAEQATIAMAGNTAKGTAILGAIERALTSNARTEYAL